MRSDRSTLETRLALLKQENERLKQIAVDLHWMSRRYANGRASGAVSLHNGHTRSLLDMGVELNATGDGTVWAIDGMRTESQFRDLPDACFERGHPLATGTVLGLLPHRSLARCVEDVLGPDPLKAVLKYRAAAIIAEVVAGDWENLRQWSPLLAGALEQPLEVLKRCEADE